MTERFVPASCGGEKCWCGASAEHKVEETIFADDPTGWSEWPGPGYTRRSLARHPLTSYICHEHFVQLMGPAAEALAERQQREKPFEPPYRVLP